MPREIYNEGRVVGYSAYEIYAKHAEHTGFTPVTEQEWLAASLTDGSSLLLKIDKSTLDKDGVALSSDGYHILDVPLPTGTHICAANTIVGSLFTGEGHYPSGSVWADRVARYSVLIKESAHNSRTYIEAENVGIEEPQAISIWIGTFRNQLRSYSCLLDGVVIQDGYWRKFGNGSQGPANDFSPDLTDNGTGIVRLLFRGALRSDFELLLSGFTLKSVLPGMIGTDSAVQTNNPEDGDFLGPAAYPWGNQIVFSVPNSYISLLINNNYSRKLTHDSTTDTDFVDVTGKAIIDIDSQVTNYYQNAGSGSAIQTISIDVDGADGKNPFNILTVYQRFSVLPPALYASVAVNDTQAFKLYPVDTVAPGTVKMYTDSDLASGQTKVQKIDALETNAPKNIGFVKSEDAIIWQKSVNTSKAVPVADTSYRPDPSQVNSAAIAQIRTGDKTAYALSMAQNDGTLYQVDGTGGTNVSEMLSWYGLLQALKDNKKIDFLGSDRFYTILADKLIQSKGITLTKNATAKTITFSADLTEGSGVKIENDTASGHTNAKKISIKLSAGNGISFSNDSSGNIVINNSAMYPGAANGYAKVPRTSYDAWFGTSGISGYNSTNGFRSVKDSLQPTVSQSQVQNSTTTPDIRVWLLPMFDSDGTLTQCYIQVAGAGESCHIGNYSFSSANFQLHHANTIYSVPESIVFRIRFKSINWTYRGHTFNLRTLHSMSFDSQGHSGNKIWNVDGMNRGSYDVTCILDNVYPPKSGGQQDTDHKEIILSGGSISDGFNSQYQKLAQTEGKNASDLYSSWLNIFMIGTFY